MAFYINLMVYLFVGGIWITRYVNVSERIKKIILVIFLCLPIFFITAFRGPTIGNDTVTYRNLYTSLQTYDNFLANDTRFEFGFVILCRVLGFFSDQPQTLFIVCALITDYFFFRFIFKYSKMIWFSLFIFVGLRFLFFTMSGIRQALAMGLVLYSYDFIVKRKPIKFLVCIGIAALFHTAVFCAIPLYLISHYKFKISTVGVIVGISLGIFAFFNTVLRIGLMIFPRYAGYITGEKFGKFLFGNITLFMIQVMIMAIGLISGYCFPRRKLANKGESKLTLTKFSENDFLSYVALFSMLLCMFSLRGSTLDRFYTYYQIFILLFVPHAIYNIKNIKHRSLTILFFCVFLVSYNVIIFTFRPEWSTVIPYYFFWMV